MDFLPVSLFLSVLSVQTPHARVSSLFIQQWQANRSITTAAENNVKFKTNTNTEYRHNPDVKN